MKKGWKIALFGVVALVAVAALWGGLYLSSVNSYQESVDKIHIENVDLSTVPNGNYIGECDVDYIYAKVAVVVKDGRIDSIQLLEHKNEKGAAAEVITQKVIEDQSLTVDVVTGATNSSKVILRAIENAVDVIQP